MAKNIRENYYEDSYMNCECRDCRKHFIVGETLSEGIALTCPYCRSTNVDILGYSERDLRQLGIYFHKYEDGQLMLYTEVEFAVAIKAAIDKAGPDGVPVSAAYDIIKAYCARRDGRIATQMN